MVTVVAHDPLEYRHLLTQVSRSLTRNEHDREDLVQAGWEGLVEACERTPPVRSDRIQDVQTGRNIATAPCHPFECRLFPIKVMTNPTWNYLSLIRERAIQ